MWSAARGGPALGPATQPATQVVTIVTRRPRVAKRQAGGSAALRRLAEWRARVTRWPELLCAALLALMALNLVAVAARTSLTVDEVVHIPAGYTYLATGNYRLNTEHPPLAKLWSALPLLLLRPELPPVEPVKNPVRRTLDYGTAFWERNEARFDAIKIAARLPMIVLTLALGALIFRYTRRLFGPRAAVCAVALFSLEPTVLAHGRLVHTDVPAALAYLGFFVALHAYLRRPTARRALLLGLVTGLALATKFSLLVLAPVCALALLVAGWLAPRRHLSRQAVLLHASTIVLIVLLCLNAVYAFQRPPLSPSDLGWAAEIAPGRARLVETAFTLGSRVLPTDFLFGLTILARHNQAGHPAGLLGMRSEQGWWYYFPVAFALKTTLPFLALSLLALGWAGWRLLRWREGRWLLLLGPAALYLGLAMTSQINIGVRHMLPVLPFLFILGGVTLDRVLASGRPAALVLVALLFGWLGVEAVRAHPHYTAYMNQLTWQHPRWWYLSDSNIEWGDEVDALATYLQARGETQVRGAVAAGWSTLHARKIAYFDLFAPTDATLPETRYIAIGASFLNGSTVPGGAAGSGRANAEQRQHYFAAYRGRQPEAVFGQAIYLYRVVNVPPASAPLPREAFRARLTVLSATPHTLRPGETVPLRIRLHNVSDVTWPARGRDSERYRVTLGSRWFDATGGTVVRDDARAVLLDDLPAGDTMDLTLGVTAPPAAGDYVLEIDLLQEGVAWFGQRGSPALRFTVRVR